MPLLNGIPNSRCELAPVHLRAQRDYDRGLVASAFRRGGEAVRGFQEAIEPCLSEILHTDFPEDPF
jgi:hypothetical protein